MKRSPQENPAPGMSPLEKSIKSHQKLSGLFARIAVLALLELAHTQWQASELLDIANRAVAQNAITSADLGKCSTKDRYAYEGGFNWLYRNPNLVDAELRRACEQSEFCADPEALIQSWHYQFTTAEEFCSHLPSPTELGSDGQTYTTHAKVVREGSDTVPAAYTFYNEGLRGGYCTVAGVIAHEVMHLTVPEFSHHADPALRQADFIHQFGNRISKVCSESEQRRF